jgi:CCR4-NOT transcription complex subunit 4
MCLWCYHHILEEAAKASLAARCPNCRSEYDEEKIKMQHIDAEQ